MIAKFPLFGVGVIIASLALSNSAWARSFGPWFYRIGTEKSFVRWETTVDLANSNLVVHECAEHMHGLLSQGPRQCWVENLNGTEFTIDANSVRFISGDVMIFDMTTGKLSIVDLTDSQVILRNVEPGITDWFSAPASWKFGH